MTLDRFRPLLSSCGVTCLAVALSISVARGEEPKTDAPATPPGATAEPELSQEELEKQFEETLTNCQMIGSFTLAGGPTDKPLNEDKYTINKVKKLKNGLWMFDSTIQYGGNNTRIPITLPVKWASDTPVITVTNILVPGMGTFSARVLVFKDQYAGTWSGGDHGGQMFGRIVKLGAEETADSNEKKISQQETAPPAAVK